MFHKIMIAVDGSPHARAAAAVAAGIAARFQASVMVTHVRNRAGRPADPFLDAEGRRKAVGLVNQVLSELDAAGVPASGEVRTVGARSLVGSALVRAAEDYGADLVVAGSRGRSDLAGLLLGSVSHELLTKATVPVLVVRSGKRAQERPSVSAEQPAHS